MSTLTAQISDPQVSAPRRRGSVRPLRLGPYRFKRAQTDREFEQLHKLNYRIFVNEIPQHGDTGTGLLVDKFHDKNVYYVAVREKRVVGMITVHDRPPFSVAEKLEDPATIARLGDRLIEARLLAIEPGQRHSLVFAGLNWMMFQHAANGGYTHILISGYSDRLPLYRRAGFRPLGPGVRSGDATFVPMALALNDLPSDALNPVNRWKSRMRRHKQAPPVCLLPGPVTLPSQVARALQRRAISHRSGRAIRLYESVRRRLGGLVGAEQVALFCGSGTLANDVVASALAAHRRPMGGLVLVNGEFGRRLVGQCRRARLSCEAICQPWSQPWDLDRLGQVLDRRPDVGWIWGVHLESSTGMVNDVAALRRVASKRGVRVCLDCVSSIGAVPLDLDGIYLSTGSSGKALGSIAGLCMVFSSSEAIGAIASDRLPSYMDLVASVQTTGTRFTCPSGPLEALNAALDAFATPALSGAHYGHYQDMGQYVHMRLSQIGLPVLVDGPMAAPVITTFSPPHGEPSPRFVSRCRRWGYEVGGMSRYLQARRWVQIATMGRISVKAVAPLFDQLARWVDGKVVEVPISPVLQTEADPD